ncbi:MAG: hypothetical protein J5706_08465 [Elusimicrobiales bacterium]|nr:hypothetical protein [Elusimicrobiales bacterium]
MTKLKRNFIFLSVFTAVFFFMPERIIYAQSSVEEIQKTIDRTAKETKNLQSKQKSIEMEIKRKHAELDNMKRAGDANSKKYQQTQSSLNSLKKNRSELNKKLESLEAAQGIHRGNYNKVLPFALRNSANTSELYGNSDLIKSILIRYSIREYYEKAKGLDFEKKQAEIARQNALKQEKEVQRSLDKIGKNIKNYKNSRASIEKAIKERQSEKNKLSKREKELIAENNRNYAKLEEIKKILRKADENAKKKTSSPAPVVSKTDISLPAAGKILSKDSNGCVKIKTAANAPIKAVLPGKVVYDGALPGGGGKGFFVETEKKHLITYRHIVLEKFLDKGKWVDFIRHGDGVSENKKYVSQGEKIAYADSTGVFDFCVVLNDAYQDAEKYIR